MEIQQAPYKNPVSELEKHRAELLKKVEVVKLRFAQSADADTVDEFAQRLQTHIEAQFKYATDLLRDIVADPSNSSRLQLNPSLNLPEELLEAIESVEVPVVMQDLRMAARGTDGAQVVSTSHRARQRSTRVISVVSKKTKCIDAYSLTVWFFFNHSSHSRLK